MNNFKTSLIQMDIQWHDITANLQHAEKMISAINPGNSLLALPEMFTTGFTMHPANFAESMNSYTVSSMKKWSDKYNADIAGTIIIEENGLYFNRMIWTSPGNKASTYDKRHLFRIAHENEVYTSGNRNTIIECCGWKIMPFICYDLRFPVWIRNINLNYDILLFSANWPASRQSHWEILLRARAIENQCYVIGVNRTGKDGNGLIYKGGSVVFDFRGEIIARAGEKEEILHCELEYDLLQNYRNQYPFWKDADTFEIK